MIKHLLFFVIIIAKSISAYSSNEELKDIRLQLISSIHDNNCAYFSDETYNKDELQIATMYSSECANKYYKEILDSNSFEQVFMFIHFLVINDNIELATTLHKDTLKNFNDTQHLQTLNNVCLWSENYEMFIDTYIEEFPWNKSVLQQVKYCKARLENN